MRNLKTYIAKYARKYADSVIVNKIKLEPHAMARISDSYWKNPRAQIFLLILTRILTI